MNLVTITTNLTDGTVNGTLDDGSTVQLFPVQASVAPTITEVDVKESDGTVKTITP